MGMGSDPVDGAMKPVMIKGDFHRALFQKLAQISCKTEFELFLIARDEMEMGYGDHIVEGHFDKWNETRDLPPYVEDFVEQGKEQILKAGRK